MSATIRWWPAAISLWGDAWGSGHQAVAQYRSEIEAVHSLQSFPEYQPHLACAAQVHSGRLAPAMIREWTLARCGHHPFPDGRSARHSTNGARQFPCLCGGPHWNMLHGSRACALFEEQRHRWLLHMHRCHVDVVLLSDEDFLRLIFTPPHPQNSTSLVAAPCSICSIGVSAAAMVP